MKLFLCLALLGMLAFVHCNEESEDKNGEENVENKKGGEEEEGEEKEGEKEEEEGDKSGSSPVHLALLALVPVAARLF